jgi:MFS transporter, UMF1 family
MDPAAPAVHGEHVPHSRNYGRKAVAGWALYDFANSAYTTLVITFIYSTFFINRLAPNAIAGTAQWGYAIAVSAVTVAVLSPFMGALADRSGYRRPLIAATTVLTIAGSFLLYVPGPGEVALALLIVVLSNTAYELCGVFYNSYLPDIAPQDRIGRISGYGWALGYLGGLLAMGVALVGFIQPDQPWFGIGKTAGENVRATMVLVGVWFALFSLPFFFWVPDRKTPVRQTQTKGLLIGAVRQIGVTFTEIQRYRQIVRLLFARLLYNDGLYTIFAFGGGYAVATFDFTLTEVMYFGLALNITAGAGAYLMGFLDDRIGGRRTILITIVGLSVATLAAALAGSKTQFWVVGLFIGIFVGPNQAASRSLLGRLVPASKETEFFGFFALSGKAIAFLGPAMMGFFTSLFGTQRAGVAVLLLFFISGGLLLLRVNEAEGIALAARGVESAGTVTSQP